MSCGRLRVPRGNRPWTAIPVAVALVALACASGGGGGSGTGGGGGSGAGGSSGGVSCNGARCCWTDCQTAKETCGRTNFVCDKETCMDSSTNVCPSPQMPDWFTQMGCVITWEENFSAGDDMKSGFCPCLSPDGGQYGQTSFTIFDTDGPCDYRTAAAPTCAVDFGSCAGTGGGGGTGGSGGTGGASCKGGTVSASGCSKCGFGEFCEPGSSSSGVHCLRICDTDADCCSPNKCMQNQWVSSAYGGKICSQNGL